MAEDDREKRLYYLRKYNRYYKDQIDLLTNQSISFERQMNELKEENERLKKQLLKNETYAEKQPNQTLPLEIRYIRKLIEQLCATQHIPIHSNDFEQDQQRDHFIGAIHRQKQESTYANEIREEFVIKMNEEMNDDRLKEEQDPSDPKDHVEQLDSKGEALQDELQTDDKNESTLSRQVKQYGKIEETSPQKAIPEQDEKQSLPPAERRNTITFRELQQATDIYAKPPMKMNQSKSTGIKQPHSDTSFTQVEQEEHYLPALSKKHKKPEIVQRPIPERVEQPTQQLKNDQPTEEAGGKNPVPNNDRAKEKIEQPKDEKIVTEKNDNQQEKQVEDTSHVSNQTDPNERVDRTDVSSLHPSVDSQPPKKEIDIKPLPIQEKIQTEETNRKESEHQTEQAKQANERSIEHTNQPTFLKTLWNKIKRT